MAELCGLAEAALERFTPRAWRAGHDYTAIAGDKEWVVLWRESSLGAVVAELSVSGQMPAAAKLLVYLTEEAPAPVPSGPRRRRVFWWKEEAA